MNKFFILGLGIFLLVIGGVYAESVQQSFSGIVLPEPLSLIVFSPVDDVYNSRRILISLEANEEADRIEYMDSTDKNPRWRTLCRNCDVHGKLKSFSDGEHNLSFRAIKDEEAAFANGYDFFIDAKDPRILRTEPKRGLTNGKFGVEFREDNPEELILYYADRSKILDIENECDLEGTRHKCETMVDLSDFNGNEIEYRFNITDIAGNNDESRPTSIGVDTTNPELLDLLLDVNGRRITFNLLVNEENFEIAEYFDHEAKNPDWKRLCSKLKNGMCVAKKTFAVGTHNIDVRVLDEAGNIVQESRVVEIL